MKKSELRQIIREEIQKLYESDSSNDLPQSELEDLKQQILNQFIQNLPSEFKLLKVTDPEMFEDVIGTLKGAIKNANSLEEIQLNLMNLYTGGSENLNENIFKTAKAKLVQGRKNFMNWWRAGGKEEVIDFALDMLLAILQGLASGASKSSSKSSGRRFGGGKFGGGGASGRY